MGVNSERTTQESAINDGFRKEKKTRNPTLISDSLFPSLTGRTSYTTRTLIGDHHQDGRPGKESCLVVHLVVPRECGRVVGLFFNEK